MKTLTPLSSYTGWVAALVFALLAAWFALGGPIDFASAPTVSSAPPGRALAPASGGQRAIFIYLPGDDGGALVPREASVAAGAPVADQAREALVELARLDAQDPGMFSNGLTVNSVFVYDGLAVISLKDGFQRSGMGAWTELLAVMSLVNTVSLGFDEIERAQILVDGKPAQTFAGHVWIERPLAPDMSLIASEAPIP